MLWPFYKCPYIYILSGYILGETFASNLWPLLTAVQGDSISADAIAGQLSSHKNGNRALHILSLSELAGTPTMLRLTLLECHLTSHYNGLQNRFLTSSNSDIYVYGYIQNRSVTCVWCNKPISLSTLAWPLRRGIGPAYAAACSS